MLRVVGGIHTTSGGVSAEDPATDATLTRRMTGGVVRLTQDDGRSESARAGCREEVDARRRWVRNADALDDAEGCFQLGWMI